MLVSECMTSEESLEDWAYLERHLLSVLADFETESEAQEFVRVKINSLLAVAEDVPDRAAVAAVDVVEAADVTDVAVTGTVSFESSFHIASVAR